MKNQHHSDYVLGHSDGELDRLMRQSAMYADITEELLHSAGIKQGMQVLDVGCGAGCVSLLTARLVGPSGTVVGVDISPSALALARSRADAEHLGHVEFIQSDLADLQCRDGFDALVGRFVLMYQPNPSAILQKLKRHVRNGGVIAFQEMDISAARTEPDMPLWHQCGEWIRRTFQSANVDVQMGPKLHAAFLHAGLPQPQMQLQAKVGGAPDCSAHEYITDIITTMLPMMERFGVATAAMVGIETLAVRLRKEMENKDGVMILPSLVGAWVKTPG